MEMGRSNRTGAVSLQAAMPPDKTTTRQRVAELADRALAGEKAGDTNERVGTALHAEKIDEIRRKIDEGYYDRADVKKMIADRLGPGLGAK
jgi:hypothetical protein